MHLINDVLEDGGVVDKAGGDFLVEESDTPGMHVKMAKGTIYVPNSAWIANSWEPKFYRIISDTVETAIPIASNASGQARVDLICIEVDKVTVPNDNADNVALTTVVEGTPGAGAPAVPNDMEVVAQISVPDGETLIETANITDRRRQVFARPSLTNSGIVEKTDAATVTFDSEDGKYTKFHVTIAGNRTFVFSNFPIGVPVLIDVQQGSGAPRTPVWPTVKWSPEGETPDMSDTTGHSDTFVFMKRTDGTYLGWFAGIDHF